MKFGIARVLHKHGSGREFFQNLRIESPGESTIKRQDFQGGLKSKRRLDHLTSINKNYLTPRAMAALHENQGDLEESLKDFHVYAADGHFHATSTHDPGDEEGRKHATGHLYALNLRNRDMGHLALSSDGKRKKPHDMGTLKRMEAGNCKKRPESSLRLGPRLHRLPLMDAQEAQQRDLFPDKNQGQHD